MKDRIAAIQRALGVDDDGILGNITLTALEKRLNIAPETQGAGAGPNELISSLPSVAEGELGTKETSRNQGPGIAKYWIATNYPDGYKNREPYCAAFMSWLFMEAGKRVELPCRRPTTAAAFGFETWGRDNGLTVVKEPRKVKRGDVVVFSFSRVGICEEDSDESGTFTTIEANTNAAGDREGGCVMRKRRKLSLVRSVVSAN